MRVKQQPPPFKIFLNLKINTVISSSNLKQLFNLKFKPKKKKFKIN